MTQLFIPLFFLPLLSPSFQLYPAVVCKESNCSSSIKIQCFLFSLNNKYVVDVFLHFIAHSTNVWLGMATGKYFLKTESSLRFRKLPQLSDLKKKPQQNGMPVTYQLIKIHFFYQYRHGLQNRLTLSKACQWHTISTTMYSCDRR